MFVVLPFVVVGGKTNEAWRRRLLERHTLLACLKLDKNLFYPVAEATYAIILKAHETSSQRKHGFHGKPVRRQSPPKAIQDVVGLRRFGQRRENDG